MFVVVVVVVVAVVDDVGEGMAVCAYGKNVVRLEGKTGSSGFDVCRC